MEKRSTRSQVTLPDNILQVSQESPLKKARSTKRNRSNTNTTTSSFAEQPSLNADARTDSEDPILLSPRKPEIELVAQEEKGSKRSASPPPHDEYAQVEPPEMGRELKRLKTGLTPNDPTTVQSTKPHSSGGSSSSNIELGSAGFPRKRRTRQGTRSGAGEPKSTGPSAESTPPPDPVTGRAQSVPVFSNAYQLPQIDLRHPPPSPTRPHSRAPSKEPTPKLQMKPLPKLTTSLDTIPGSPDKMNVDSAPDDGPANPFHETPAIDEVSAPASVVSPEEQPIPAPASPVFKVQAKLVETPFSKPQNTNALGMSPLTPVPPTPFPAAKFQATQSKLRQGGVPESSTNQDAPLASKATTSKSTTKNTFPIRPTASGPAAKNPAPKLTAKDAFKKAAAGKPVASGSKPNAFAAMMANARASSSSKATVTGQSKPPVAGPSKQQGKRQATVPPVNVFGESSKPKPAPPTTATGSRLANRMKPSMKSTMKPAKGKKRDAAAPALVPIPLDEEDMMEAQPVEEHVDKKVDTVGGVMPEKEPGVKGVLDEEQSTPEVGVERTPEPKPVEEDALKVHQEAEVEETTADLELPAANDEVEADSNPLVEFVDAQPGPAIDPQPSGPEPDPVSPVIDSNLGLEPECMGVQVSMPMFDATTISPPTSPVTFIFSVPPSVSNDTALHDVDMQEIDSNVEENPVTEETEVVAADEMETTAEVVQVSEADNDHIDLEQPVLETEDTQIEVDKNEHEQVQEPIVDGKRRSGRQSKLPRPPAAPSRARSTRVASSSKCKKDAKTTEPPQPKASTSKTAKPPVASTSSKPVARSVSQDLVSLSTKPVEEPPTMLPHKTPPASPRKISGPAKLPTTPTRNSPRTRTVSTPTLRTPGASPTKSRIPVKRAHSPSPAKPAKLARSASLTHSRTSSGSRFTGNGTLSTLSNALEKLRMPAPSRPNTSLGFNRDVEKDDDDTMAAASTSKVQDDSNLGKKSSSSSTVQPSVKGKGPAFGNGVGSSVNHGHAPATAGSKPMMKQSTLLFPRAPNRAVPKKAFLGTGQGRLPKASRNPGLATVIGSPVKGGGSSSNNAMAEGDEDESGMSVGNTPGSANGGAEEPSPFLEMTVPLIAQDKGKGRAKDEFSTRRASAISHELSESILNFQSEVAANANGNGKGKGLMGPPPVPANLSARSAGSAGGEAGETSASPPGRKSTRVAAAAATQALATVFNKKPSDVDKPPVNEALKFLKDCVIYVDVKTDDAEEAGSLFIEMLEGVGAKILQRVGQSCTHIVYKNGMQSTINRYKLLRDPKPLVVGIAWVVDCVEQRQRVPEQEYLIDLEEVSLLTNPSKRRRSLLPKLISRQFSDVSMGSDTVGGSKDESHDGDVSMESASSLLDDLPPLERARLRKSMMPS